MEQSKPAPNQNKICKCRTCFFLAKQFNTKLFWVFFLIWSILQKYQTESIFLRWLVCFESVFTCRESRIQNERGEKSRNVLQTQAVVDRINKTHLTFPLAAVDVTVKPKLLVKPLTLTLHSGPHGSYSWILKPAWRVQVLLPPPVLVIFGQIWHSRSGPGPQRGWTCWGWRWGRWLHQKPCKMQGIKKNKYILKYIICLGCFELTYSCLFYTSLISTSLFLFHFEIFKTLPSVQFWLAPHRSALLSSEK